MSKFLNLTIVCLGIQSISCWESRKTPEQNNAAEDRGKLNSVRFAASGAGVVPPVTAMGTAGGGCFLSEDGTLGILVKGEGLSGPPIAAHLHIAIAGQNGPVVYDFPKAGFVIEDSGHTASVDGSWKLTPGQLT